MTWVNTYLIRQTGQIERRVGVLLLSSEKRGRGGLSVVGGRGVNQANSCEWTTCVCSHSVSPHSAFRGEFSEHLEGR